MKVTRLVSLAMLAAVSCVAQTVVYKCDFSAESLKAWNLKATTKGVTVDGKTCLQVTLDEKTGDNGRVQLPFDFTPYAGKSLTLRMKVKCQGVTQPPHYWNGTKLQCVYDTHGKINYKNGGNTWGTYDWKTLEHGFVVDSDVQPGGYIEIGLQECKGTAWFTDLCVEMPDLAKIFPQFTPDDYRCEYTDAVRKRPRMRGVMSPGAFNPETTIQKDLPDLKSWGANIIRWQLIRGWHKRNDNQDSTEYLSWVDARIPEVKQVLDKCRELGIWVVLDLHVAPGGRAENGCMNMFEKKEFAETFEQAWIHLATAVKGHPALYGYDLINEPYQKVQKAACMDYLSLQYLVARTVRRIDSETPIIIESNDASSPSTYPYLSALPLKDIIYQVHMYYPGAYTHQGVGVNRLPKDPEPYPNEKKHYTARELRKYLEPAREFERRHGAKIYVGEFSAARWALGAENYLTDVIDIFEEYGWDWCYHAFRESATWDVEKEGTSYSDVRVAKEDTPRKKALLRGFSKNSMNE